MPCRGLMQGFAGNTAVTIVSDRNCMHGHCVMGQHLDLGRQLGLVLVLDGAPLFLEVLVIRVLAQARQQVEVVGPGVCAQRLCDQGCQPRVAPGQPPPRRDAVRLVLELVGR